jgi:hypothetical protein
MRLQACFESIAGTGEASIVFDVLCEVLVSGIICFQGGTAGVLPGREGNKKERGNGSGRREPATYA